MFTLAPSPFTGIIPGLQVEKLSNAEANSFAEGGRAPRLKPGRAMWAPIPASAICGPILATVISVGVPRVGLNGKSMRELGWDIGGYDPSGRL